MVGLLKFVARVVAFLPAGMVRAWARHWGWLLAHVARIRRGYVLETLARCLPDVTVAERRRIYVEMWQHQVLNIMELMRFYGGRRAEFAEGLEVYGEEHEMCIRDSLWLWAQAPYHPRWYCRQG